MSTTLTQRDLPGLELVKALALLAMLVDHVDLVLFGRAWSVTYDIGRFALPAFFGAFAVGLARSKDPRHAVAALVLPAAVAQAAWAISGARDDLVLNVLFVAAYLAATVSVLRAHRVLGAGLVVLGLAVYPIFEGGWFTLALFWASYLAAAAQRPLLASLGVAPVLAVTPGLAGVLGLAAPHLAAYLPGFRRGVVPWAWVYAAHLALLAGLKAATLV